MGIKITARMIKQGNVLPFFLTSFPGFSMVTHQGGLSPVGLFPRLRLGTRQLSAGAGGPAGKGTGAEIVNHSSVTVTAARLPP